MNLSYTLWNRFRVGVLLLLTIGLTCFAVSAKADGEIPPAEELLSNGMVGTEFWFAIPPSNAFIGSQQALFFYITSFVDTEIKMEIGGGRVGTVTREIKANQVTVLSSNDGSASWSWEVSQSEKKQDLGIQLLADDPIVVSVVTAKSRAADGFAVIPRRLLGRDYLHVGYYDTPGVFNTFNGSGFIIVATEDGTSVTYDLKGIDVGDGKTEGGREIGERETVTLAAGQVYMVKGDGKADRGTFDLTGSRITGNKPFGIVSFHEQVILPAAAQFSRGGLAEMLPPVSSWGTELISHEYIGGASQGTYYRIVAARDATAYEAVSMGLDGAVKSRKSGLIANAGEFKDFENVNPQTNQGAFLRQIVHWTADKPIMVMKYSMGENFFDARPYMLAVPPLGQTLSFGRFVVPPDASGNRLHIFAEGDPDDPEKKKRLSLLINGQSVASKSPQFLVARVGETNFFYANLQVEPGAYTLEGDTRFTAYAYGDISGGGGFALGGYGYPVATAVNQLAANDTQAPEASFKESCGRFEVTVTDNEAIAAVEFYHEQSVNAFFEYVTPVEVLKNYGVKSFKFAVEPDPENRTSPATAVYGILDRAGNRDILTVNIPAASDFIELEDSRIRYSGVLLEESKTETLTIVNPSEESIRVESLELRTGTVFEIISDVPKPFTIPGNNGQFTFDVRYSPAAESVDGESDTDTVVATTTCREYVLGLLSGSGVAPHIQTEGGWDAGNVTCETKVCFDENDDVQIVIRNTGTADLTITDYVLDDGTPFDLSQVSPAIGETLTPGEERFVTNICFEPIEEGQYQTTVQVMSDALGDETVNSFQFDLQGEGVCLVDDVTDPRYEGYLLSSSAPNPADNTTTVRYTLGGDDHVRLDLFDALGNVIQTLVDEQQTIGEYAVSIVTKELPSGVYHYRLNAGPFSATASFVIAR